MKKMAILGIGIVLLLTGCNYHGGNGAGVNKVEESKTVKQSAVTQMKQQIYFEKKVKIGLGKASTIQLAADENAVSGKKLLINGNAVDLSKKSELQNENCNHVKLLTNDFDNDGIQEILLLFYGGAGGTFQQFCLLKYGNKVWNIVDEDFLLPDSSLVKIKKQAKGKIKIELTNTAFEKVIDLPQNTNIRNESDIHIACRLFKLSGTKIILGLRLLNQGDDGDLLGDIRQEIYFDSVSQKLKLSKTEYLSKGKAKREKYEIY